MSEINLIDFHGALADTFRRYLYTLNFFPDGESELRAAFWNALHAKDIFHRAPLLSVIPAYRQECPTSTLLGEGLAPRLHKALSKLPVGAFDIKRPLYSHQVRGLKLAQEAQSFIVATGTGSGKTECFLLPLLDDALRHPGDGVRSIVVYPLNALANDQLGRLRNLLPPLPEVTFGRYTGDTPQNRKDASDSDLKEILDRNERFSRDEIRSSPPHILLTNFAMLEYLLLRPKDSDIFRHQRLKYVVLDEAHTYAGAQGIEVSLLMRRLQQAFPKCNLQFILTSATLGSDRAEIAHFGQSLTGASFNKQSVVLGEIVDPFMPPLNKPIPLARYLSVVPDAASLNQWIAALDDCNVLQGMIADCGLNHEMDLAHEGSTGAVLAKWLCHNAELARLHQIASDHPVTLAEASEELWKDTCDDALRIMHWLVVLGSRAVVDVNSPPLLPARYHLFFRGLRGGSLCLAPHCSGRKTHPTTVWSSLFLEDRVTCAEPECDAHVLPLLTCVHCGAPVLRVFEDLTGHWQAIRPAVDLPAHLLTWNVNNLEEEDDDEQDDGIGRREAHLCLNCCGILLGGKLPEKCCSNPKQIVLWVIKNPKANGLLTKCPTCGGQKGSYQSVLRELSTGEDAATAVLAEAVVRALPEGDISKPAHGRRLLAFSDSRQRAAHFAPYLGRTTAETQYMKPLVDAIRATVADSTAANEHGATFDAISERFLTFAKKQPYLIIRKTSDEDGEFTSSIKRPGQLFRDDLETLKRECLISLLQHFTAPLRSKNNLPGLSLAWTQVEWNDEQRQECPSRLPEVFSEGEELGWLVLQNLLQVVLRRRAVDLPDGILLGQIQSVGPKVVTMHHNRAGSLDGRRLMRWNPYTARQVDRVVLSSPQAEIIARFLQKDKLQDKALISNLLDKIWDTFRDLEVLRMVHADEFVLPYDHLLVEMAGTWYSCVRCGALTPLPIRDTCVIPGCGGRVQPLLLPDIRSRWIDHHWYRRYTETEPLPLEVREHTAQLTNEAGRDYQRRFTDEDINVLSSSTTFEMGVDVGQLKSVFLRNVPPTPANYIQRAGRAGRRREGAAYAITYARSFPHDQVHYHDPLGIVSGTVPVPRINLSNIRLTQRHINSFLLGRFLKGASIDSAREQITVDEFFLSPTREMAAATRYGDWLNEHADMLRTSAQYLIDESCTVNIDAFFKESVEMLRSAQASVVDQLSAYKSQADELEAIVKAAGGGGERFAALRNVESVLRLADQLKGERLIDHLASAHWLPSYAFPQNVVKLLVRQPSLTDRMRLERDAEYGIAEYAPGSEVVVDGRLITSSGIDLQNKVLEVRYYRVCSLCNRVQIETTRSDISPICTSCGRLASGKRSKTRSFVVPRGFTTRIDEPVKDVRLNRLKAPPNSEVFLVDGARPDSFVQHPQISGVSLGYCSNGQLFRANSGRNFQAFKICARCGSGFDKTQVSHKTPWGAKCSNRTLTVADLVCRFETDTLQIRFDGVHPPPPTVDNIGFWISLQTAFTAAAADLLVIPARDLDGTFRSQSEAGMRGELVVYDRVPGGAGYVSRISEELPAILESTLRRVLNCTNSQCDPQGSCYTCLRSYGNQFQWENLHRNLVSDWLADVLHPGSRITKP
jgi:hypothetical protein